MVAVGNSRQPMEMTERDDRERGQKEMVERYCREGQQMTKRFGISITLAQDILGDPFFSGLQVIDITRCTLVFQT